MSLIILPDGKKILPSDTDQFRREIASYSIECIKGMSPLTSLPEDEAFAADLGGRKAAYEKEKGYGRYKDDYASLTKRYTTGLKTEIVIHRMIYGNLDKFDTKVESNYMTPDFIDVTMGSVFYPSLGVKSVNKGLCPMVFKNSTYPEIICIVDNELIYPLGIASVEVLRKYQHEFLIATIKARKTKGGFYGFWALAPLPKIKQEADWAF